MKINVKEKKIIVLIIASDDKDYYIEMQKCWRLYMNNHKNIKCYFIKCNPLINEHVIINEEENTIYCKLKETYVPGLLLKTLMSITHIYNTMDFDYIYRTNLSSLIDLNKMYNYINKRTINYGGVIVNYEHKLSKPSFASGAGFWLRKNVCKYIIDNLDRINILLVDDVALGLLLCPIYGINSELRIDINNKDLVTSKMIDNEVYHYRCKVEDNMMETCEIQKKLIKIIY